MKSIWEAVLASSFVSKFFSAALAGLSSLRTEKRQRDIAAQHLARALEDYARSCSRQIEDENRVEFIDDDGQRWDVKLPDMNLSSLELDRLKPSWRDRISAFPDRINESRRYLNLQYDIEGSPNLRLLSHRHAATLGRAAFALAKNIREGHNLPTKDASKEYLSALRTFDETDEMERKYEKWQEDSNASMNAHMCSALTAGIQNKPAGSASLSQL